MMLEIFVIPNSKKFKIENKKGRIKIYVKSEPENNMANHELIKELSRLTGKPVQLLSGVRSKLKRIEVDLTLAEFSSIFKES